MDTVTADTIALRRSRASFSIDILSKDFWALFPLEFDLVPRLPKFVTLRLGVKQFYSTTERNLA